MIHQKQNRRRNLLIALSFLLPNILGVLTFVVIPVLFAVMLAFTNWDLRYHNVFQDETLKFVGLDNFIRLFTEENFLKYLGNTLFLMMGIPFGIAGALCAALMLSKDVRAGGGQVYGWLIAGGVLVASTMMLAAVGLAGTAVAILFCGLAAGILLLGMTGGITIYRTLFYTPHFTAGVATFILWKKLYNPNTGPINSFLRIPLSGIESTVTSVSPVWMQVGFYVGIALMLLLMFVAARWAWKMWNDGDIGNGSAVFPVVFLSLPVVLMQFWGYTSGSVAAFIALAVAAVIVLYFVSKGWRQGPAFPSAGAMNGVGNAIVFSVGTMVGMLAIMGLSVVVFNLPTMAVDGNGLEPPDWLVSYHWAKPAMMLIGFWGAIGSNNMLLYLAALTNVPGELYEAADIDGASGFQKFWNVTWPQLAPTTFFIGVMATIHGLQGGFEMARVLTQGGPAGATTTLSYFIYQEGFETGRLSFSAAVAWALFILVFSITMFNWKFGNRYVND